MHGIIGSHTFFVTNPFYCNMGVDTKEALGAEAPRPPPQKKRTKKRSLGYICYPPQENHAYCTGYQSEI